MSDDRLARMEDALDALRRAAKGNIVVVEGRRDVEALETLGIGGEHRIVHGGRTLQDFIDGLVEEGAGRTIILLLDWDRTGGRICGRLRDGLSGRAPIDLGARRGLSRAATSRCVEHVPGELAALRRQAAEHRP